MSSLAFNVIKLARVWTWHRAYIMLVDIGENLLDFTGNNGRTTLAEQNCRPCVFLRTAGLFPKLTSTESTW